MKACKFIRGGEPFRGKQGLDYFAGISAETAGSEAICMHLLAMPLGAAAKAHYVEERPKRFRDHQQREMSAVAVGKIPHLSGR
ncbi:hypothetical protein [Mesorhizobium sp. IMUNJ 23232]|uniref:hypothetical protein n=1 Tax=Mesorhizobium sp. IMUNJ 23232 TaxID=3376064 RepID=UPI0037B0BC9C